MLHQAGELAQKRYARGLRLNYVEATALLSLVLLERIRDGEGLAELMNEGKQILGTAEVMEGVPEMLREFHVEGTFPDGTKLLTVHRPICRTLERPELALYGSALRRENPPIPESDTSSHPQPGEVLVDDQPIVINQNRKTITLLVTNLGDRPVQVGSHYPFFETNAALEFDRTKAYGFRLDIPSGTALRFEPGDTREVPLVEIAGRRVVKGCNGLIDGELSDANLQVALGRVRSQGFAQKEMTA